MEVGSSSGFPSEPEEAARAGEHPASSTPGKPRCKPRAAASIALGQQRWPRPVVYSVGEFIVVLLGKREASCLCGRTWWQRLYI